MPFPFFCYKNVHCSASTALPRWELCVTNVSDHEKSLFSSCESLKRITKKIALIKFYFAT